MPRKVFVAGEILTAADLQANAVDQSIMQFAGTASRGSAIPSPIEGMASYIADQDLVQIYDGAAWKNSLSVTGGILQVQQGFFLSDFSTGSTTYTDVTDMVVTITPKSSSSRFLITTSFNARASSSLLANFELRRNSTTIFEEITQALGDPAVTPGAVQNVTMAFVDTPVLGSAITYRLRAKIGSGTLTLFNGSFIVLEVAA